MGRRLVVVLLLCTLAGILPQPVAAQQALAPMSVSVRQLEGTEGDHEPTQAVMEVTLSRSSATPVSISYDTVWFTAVVLMNNQCNMTLPTFCAEPGRDYLDSAGTLVFEGEETSKTFNLTILPDDESERAEEFFLIELTEAPAQQPALVGDGYHSVYIRDDDPAMSVDWYTPVEEGNSGTRDVVVTVSTSVPPGEPVSVDFETTEANPRIYGPTSVAKPGRDFVRASGRLVFLPGEETKSITLKVKGDLLAEGNKVKEAPQFEHFYVQLSNPQKADLWSETGTIEINDDDAGSPWNNPTPDDMINVPATFTMTPNATVGKVPGSHEVQATVRDKYGSPVAVSDVIFSVSGGNFRQGSTRTDNGGSASFRYDALVPGQDTIKGFADTNRNGTWNQGEPRATVTHSWASPIRLR